MALRLKPEGQWRGSVRRVAIRIRKVIRSPFLKDVNDFRERKLVMTSFKMLVLVVLIFLFPYSPLGFSQGIAGRVVAESGEPLAGVRVLNVYLGEAMTSEGGQFQIESKSALPAGRTIEQVLRFTRAGYGPTTRVVTAGVPVEVILQKAVSAAWTPPLCSSTKDLMVGELMAFTLPKGAKVVRGRDIDYSIVGVEFKGSAVHLGWGPNWSWGLPSPAFFKGISKVDERDLEFHPDVPIAEYKGIRSNGKYFRRIGMFGETIEYEDASKEAAAFFDTIIDSLCWTREPYTGPLK